MSISLDIEKIRNDIIINSKKIDEIKLEKWRDSMIISNRSIEPYLQQFCCLSCKRCLMVLKCDMCSNNCCNKHKTCKICVNCTKNIIPCYFFCDEKLPAKCTRFLIQRGIFGVTKTNNILYLTHLELLKIKLKIKSEKIWIYKQVIIFPSDLEMIYLSPKDNKSIGKINVPTYQIGLSPSQLIYIIEQYLVTEPIINLYGLTENDYRLLYGRIGYEISATLDKERGAVVISDIVHSVFTPEDNLLFLEFIGDKS